LDAIKKRGTNGVKFEISWKHAAVFEEKTENTRKLGKGGILQLTSQSHEVTRHSVIFLRASKVIN